MPKPVRLLIYATFAVVAFLIGQDGLDQRAVFVPPLCVLLSCVLNGRLSPIDEYDRSHITGAHHTDNPSEYYPEYAKLSKEVIAQKTAERNNGQLGTFSRALVLAYVAASIGLGIFWFGLSFSAFIVGAVVAAVAGIVGLIIYVELHITIHI